MAELNTDKTAQAHVAGPEGREPTREEAEAMAAALFDQIAANRAGNPTPQ